jgi:putative sterol carrier protein
VPRNSKSKPDAIGAFFADISTRGQIPLLGTTTGTLRFDVSDGAGVEHWYVTVNDGDITVSHKNAKADTIVRIAKDLLEDIAEGRRQAFAATLRGALVVEGDIRLLISFQRLFPGQAGSKGRVAPITEVAQNR